MVYKEYNKFVLENNIIGQSDNIKQISTNFKSILHNSKKLDNDIIRLITWDYELFSCAEIVNENRESNQPFLCPCIVYSDGYKFPDLYKFENERVKFYKERKENVCNNYAKIRYLNYLIDFGIKKEKYIYAKELCNELLIYLNSELCLNKLLTSISRVIEISMSFKIKEIVLKLDSIIYKVFAREYSHADDFLILGLARDIVDIKNKDDFLMTETSKIIIEKLENLSEHYYDLKDLATFRSFSCVLLNWYKFMKFKDKENNELCRHGDSFIQDSKNKKKSYFERAYFLELAIEFFIKHGFKEKIYEAKVNLKELYKNASKEVNVERVKLDIDNKIIEEELKLFITGDTVEDFSNFCKALFILSEESSKGKLLAEKIFPSREKSLECAKKRLFNNPYYEIISSCKMTKSRKIFETKNKDDYLKLFEYDDYNMHLQLMINLFYNNIWYKLINEGLTCEMLIERIISWKYLDEDDTYIITCGIKRFFENDYISAIHILVPKFENIFREFFSYGGFATTSIKHNITQHEQNFNDFLLNDYVKENISNKFIDLIKFIMVEDLGYNLRNNIAHGLTTIDIFNQNTANIIILLFIILTQYEWNF